MRKLLWCCSAAWVFAAGSLLFSGYYACSYPDSCVGRFLLTAAQVSVGVQPFTGLASLAMRVEQVSSHASEMAGSAEECIPAEPQPVAPQVNEEKEEHVVGQAEIGCLMPQGDPIVIREDEPVARNEPAPIAPSTIDMDGMKEQQVPEKVCPIVMPYCQDDEIERTTPPHMPYAEAEKEMPSKPQKPNATATEEPSNANVFNAWKRLWESGNEESSSEVEELPYPKEEPTNESHQEEIEHHPVHSSCCPQTICPYTGKSYPTYIPPSKRGKEETCEEQPPTKVEPSAQKHHGSKGCDKEHQCPRTQGVDTMEYRRSDGGLNEYGPHPFH
jgi:hypothetical protein